jgi:signal transduction histidine kinase
MRNPSNYNSAFSIFLNFFHHQPSTQEVAKNNFLPSLIHELKTPLNAIISYSEIMQQELSDENKKSKNQESCKEYLEEISQAAITLNDLIHDLLDVSAIQSGNFSVDLSKEIDITNIIKSSVKLNYAYALKRQIKIEAKISKIKPIKLDSKRTKQIITNIISNSVKYSPDNTIISVEAYSCSDSVIVKIKDQGFGMSPEQVSKAFDKYQTFKNPNSKIVDSFGMGLSIVKELVDAQKGSIKIKSKLNQGTEVELKFHY